MLKDPNEFRYDNKHDTNGWVNLSVIRCFYWELFTVSRWTYIEPYGKNYQEGSDALKKNVVQYRGEAGLSKHPLWMKCFTN